MAQTFTSQPTLLGNAGSGIPWEQPTYATKFGIGSQNPATITSVTISGNVVTLGTTAQPTPFVAGQSVAISEMINSTFLNGVTLVVLAGAGASQFSANFTHSDLALITDAGLATPTTAFAFAQNIDQAVTPAPGQYVTYAMAQGPWHGGGSFSANQLGDPCNYWAFGQQCGGFGGCSVLEPTITTISPTVTVPSLPAGASIVSVFPVALASQDTSAGGFIGLVAKFADGTSSTFTMNGAWERGSNVDVSQVGTATFQLSILSSRTGIYSYWGNVQAVGFAIVYNFPGGTGSPIPPNQLQTLEGTDCGFAVPTNTSASGIAVTLNTGIAYGTTCTLQVQLTVSGIPIGSSKPLSVGPWATSYVLGGSGDMWGIGTLLAGQVNGTNGLGVNINGTLADGTQVNLNSLELTVTATIVRPVVWVSIGNTRPPTV